MSNVSLRIFNMKKSIGKISHILLYEPSVLFSVCADKGYFCKKKGML